jgi:hypothetical protein
MLEVFCDTQGYYEFIVEGCIVNKEMYVRILSSPQGRSEKEMSGKNVHGTAGFFCITIHCTSIVGGQKSTLPSTVLRLWSIYHIPRNCHCLTFSYFQF